MLKRLFLVFVVILFFESPALADPLPLFTHRYDRTSEKPNVYTDTVPACNTEATYTLVVINGQNGEDVISSASIALNGVEIVRENEFNQRVERVEKAVTLQPENILNIRLASGPGGFVTVNIFCSANCPAIEITSPEDLSAVNKSEAIVSGLLHNASGETGVAITNRDVEVLSQVQGENFSGIVPLQSGSNTIIATAADACGLKVKDTVTVNTDTVEEPVGLTVSPSSGVLSTTGTLEVILEAEVYIPNPVSNYSWDFNGDGVIEREGAGLATVIASYGQGLYFPAVTVTDTLGNTYTEATVVNVLSRAEVDTMLKGKWAGMKGELVSGDINNALGFFLKSSQERYREGLEVLKSQMGTIFGRPEELLLEDVVDGVATYENIVTEDDGITYSYPVIFILDEDGLWRIKSF